MKRERLMSGQRWYFEEDGFDITLDLVVDIWDKVTCKETSRVMIGGFWYDEETVQKMVSGRRNSFYRYDGDNKFWHYCDVTRDMKVVLKVLHRYMDRTDVYTLRDDSYVFKIARGVVSELAEQEYGIAMSDDVINIDGVMFFVTSIALAVRDIRETVTVF